MGGPRSGRLAVAAIVAALVASGCTANDSQPTATDSPDGTPPATPTPSGSPTSTTDALLDWQPVGAGIERTVTRGRTWTATQAKDNTRVTLNDAKESIIVAAGSRRSVTDVLLEEPYAVVVSQDDLETRPNRVTVVDLSTGERTLLGTDGAAPLPATGGPWAIGGGNVSYATYGPRGAYCLAEASLATMTGQVAYCSPRRHGLSNVTIAPEGTGMLTFDARRPVACRTPVILQEATPPTPVEAIPACKGWDLLPTTSGAVWSTIPNERSIESARFFASVDQRVEPLGPGTSGSLLWCGDSAFFARDAQRDSGRARLMRWTADDSLEVAYASPGRGPAFLSGPRCADGVLTVTAIGESGDEQVFASLPE